MDSSKYALFTWNIWHVYFPAKASEVQYFLVEQSRKSESSQLELKPFNSKNMSGWNLYNSFYQVRWEIWKTRVRGKILLLFPHKWSLTRILEHEHDHWQTRRLWPFHENQLCRQFITPEIYWHKHRLHY